MFEYEEMRKTDYIVECGGCEKLANGQYYVLNLMIPGNVGLVLRKLFQFMNKVPKHE